MCERNTYYRGTTSLDHIRMKFIIDFTGTVRPVATVVELPLVP